MCVKKLITLSDDHNFLRVICYSPKRNLKHFHALPQTAPSEKKISNNYVTRYAYPFLLPKFTL